MDELVSAAAERDVLEDQLLTFVIRETVPLFPQGEHTAHTAEDGVAGLSSSGSMFCPINRLALEPAKAPDAHSESRR